ncbi:MAG TPA: hypothetical protein EYP24_02265 [bacterium (Candidatus Stahlbacteria)]|nr:hypothetical protein [Candidatus Stahlbacteria bacterium]
MERDLNYFDLLLKSDSFPVHGFSRYLGVDSLSGSLAYIVRIRGGRERPKVEGDLTIDSIVVIKGDTIGPISGMLSLKGGDGEVRDLIVFYRGGKASVNGEIGDLKVKIEGMRIPFDERSYADVYGDLKFKGKTDSFQILGEIVLKGRYCDQIRLDLLAPKAGRTVEFLKKINLDLGLGLDFKIKNDIAHIDLTGDLRIKGTLSKPGVLGRVNIESGGRISYLGRTFIIEHGIIDLFGPINPVLDIGAETMVEYQGIKYLITLSITGSALDPVIRLESDPELPEPEIIALLLTGKTRGVLRIPTAKEAGTKAVEYLIHRIKEEIEARVARAIGLEKLTVTGSPSSPEPLRVEIEKRIRERVKISYSTGFESYKQQRFGVDYAINDNLSIYAIYDLENRDTDGGFDLHLELW